MPVLLVFADNDSIWQKHIAEFFALLGGGVKEPGWLNTQQAVRFARLHDEANPLTHRRSIPPG
jgi:hypothetical protein